MAAQQLVGLGAQQLGRRLHQPLAPQGALERHEAGHGEEPSRVRSDGALRLQRDHADLPQRVHVGAATELERTRSGPHDAHRRAVLVAEEGDRPHVLGLVARGLGGLHRVRARARPRWPVRTPRRAPRSSARRDARSRNAGTRARRGSPAGGRDRPARSAVPRAAGGSPCGCAGWPRGGRRQWWPARPGRPAPHRSTRARCATSPGTARTVSSTSAMPDSVTMVPVSPTWPPLSA